MPRVGSTFLKHHVWYVYGSRGAEVDPEMSALLMETIKDLQGLGMAHPPIRAVLYLLMSKQPGKWNKDKDYNDLCAAFSVMRDTGVMHWGILSDDVGGDNERPSTRTEIDKQLELWKEMKPLGAGPDGYLHVVFVEHIALVPMFYSWLDEKVPVVSSQGQMRREPLHAFFDWATKAAKEIGARGIKIHGFVDWDEGGGIIGRTHRAWLQEQFGLEMEVHTTREMIERAGLDPEEKHQLDGIIAVYDIRGDLRRAVGLG